MNEEMIHEPATEEVLEAPVGEEMPVGEGEMKEGHTFEERKNMIKAMLEQTTIECYRLLRVVPEIYENVSRATEDDFEEIDKHNIELMEGLRLQVLRIGR